MSVVHAVKPEKQCCRSKVVRSPSLLETAELPVEELAKLGEREGWRPQPIYQAHRWFARRFGSAFRALLVAAALPRDGDFWDAYYQGIDYRERTVLDPFVGGGTSVVEAQRLGANVIGVDVDAVACAITRFETRPSRASNLDEALASVKERVGKRLARYYRTVTPTGETRDVLHYFWVQLVECRQCGHTVEAHPHHQLAYEAEGEKQWVFCPHCHHVQVLAKDQKTFDCSQCSSLVAIHTGTVDFGKLTCPHCRTQERLIDVATRTGGPPQWRLFAVEVLEPINARRCVPMSQRHFYPASDHDQKVLKAAERALRARLEPDGRFSWVPERRIPQAGRSDNRLVDYGYTRYRELFNPRQLLHLSRLAEAIGRQEMPVREAMALAFSDHLTTSCMMTYYAFGWRRLAPLFTVRAFRHVTRPVEINPWLDGTSWAHFPTRCGRCSGQSTSPTLPGKRSSPAGSGRHLSGMRSHLDYGYREMLLSCTPTLGSSRDAGYLAETGA